MNYDEMSDLQINKAVSIALGHAYDGRGYIDDADGIYHVAIQWGRRVELPDYCNNPSDAWPIVLANNISITKCLQLDEWEVFGGGVLVDYEHCIISECGCFCSNKNPLRAAMIVFLMMHEASQ